jgi:DnaJ-class molecular chaperone
MSNKPNDDVEEKKDPRTVLLRIKRVVPCPHCQGRSERDRLYDCEHCQNAGYFEIEEEV